MALLLVGSSSWASDVRAQLRSGRILVTSGEGSGVLPGRAMAVINAPASRVRDVLLRIESYPHYMPYVRKTQRIDETTYLLRGNLPWPLDDTWAKVKVRVGRRGDTHVLSWKMVGGTLKHYQGAAWIQAWGSSRCILTYQMLAVPDLPVPNTIMNHLLRRGVKGVVKAVRKRSTAQPGAKKQAQSRATNSTTTVAR